VTKDIAAKLLEAGSQGRWLGDSAWEFIERVIAGAATGNESAVARAK